MWMHIVVDRSRSRHVRHLFADAPAQRSEPKPDRSDVPTNAAWTTGSGCTEQAAHNRRPWHQRPSESLALSWLVASVPIRCVRRSLPTTAGSLGVGTWHVGWIPGGNTWKRMRLSRHTRYRVWCAWRRAATSRLCRLASDSHQPLRRLHCNRRALSREIPVLILYAAKSPSVKGS
jgi:hypothetical protein